MVVNFKDSFNSGINSAIRIKKNIDEIEAVLSDFNNSIIEASDNRVKIFIGEDPDDSQLVALLELAGKQGRKKYIIATTNKHTGPNEKLAKWKTSDGSYPCVISYSTEEVRVNDKESLELALSTLLEHPSIGKYLYRLMNHKPPTIVKNN